MFRQVLAPSTLAEEPSWSDASTGDRDSASSTMLRRLAENHYREVWSVLRRLGVYEGVDDATQQVFLVAARRLEVIRPQSERAYLISVAVRTAANLRRSQAIHRARHVESDVLDVPSDVPLPDELIERRQLRSLLDEALDSLPADLRTAFVLFELEDLSLEEMAVVLGIPRGTVSSRLRRAREMFQLSARRLKTRLGQRRG